ncbi:MAG: hypothetical protein WC551_07760 [Patescibacteria group bacterium]
MYCSWAGVAARVEDIMITSDMFYILKGRTPVRVPPEQYAQWLGERRVALTVCTDVKVSTMFLGVDIGEEGKPLLFETALLYRAGEVEVVARYATWEEAEIGHATCVKRLQTCLQ